MAKRVDQTLSDLPLEEKPEAILAFLERELKPIVRRLRESNNELVTDTSGFATDIAALEAADVALDSRLDTAEADITALESDVADHETRITDLEAAEVASKTTMYSGGNDLVGTTAGGTFYHQPVGLRFQGGALGPATIITDAQMVWGRAGTIKNLRYINLVPNADTDTFDITLNVNGVDTALGFTGLSASTATLQSETSTSVSVAVGDLIVLKQVNGGAAITNPIRPRWCFDFLEP